MRAKPVRVNSERPWALGGCLSFLSQELGCSDMACSLFLERTRDHQAAKGYLAAFEVEYRFLKLNLGTQTIRKGDIPSENMKLVYIKTVTGEGLSLTKASSEGRATLFLAVDDKGVTALYLQEGDSIFVEGCKVLALAPTVTHKFIVMKTIAGISTAGMFSVELKGPGFIAVLTEGDPMILPVRRGNPVFTDRHATVAWSGNAVQSIHTNIHLKAAIGRSSGESFQLKFDCNPGSPGFVVIQPSEKPDDDAKETASGLVNSLVSAMLKTMNLVRL